MDKTQRVFIAASLLINPKKDFLIKFQINCFISENPEIDYILNNPLLEVDYSDLIINQIRILAVPFAIYVFGCSPASGVLCPHR